jgi:hypothetical protein
MDHINHENGFLEMKLTVFQFFDEDAKQYVAYVPSLEISSYADHENELEDCIKEAVDITVSYWIENKTLHENLTACGWVLNPEQKVQVHAEKASKFDMPGCNARQLSSFYESFRYSVA